MKQKVELEKEHKSITESAAEKEDLIDLRRAIEIGHVKEEDWNDWQYCARLCAHKQRRGIPDTRPEMDRFN